MQNIQNYLNSQSLVNNRIANGFTPNDIDGVVFWLDASGIANLNDGDPVDTWEDKGSNGYDFTQTTEVSQPLYKTNIINGKPVVRFDGDNDSLRYEEDDIVPTSGISLFIVWAKVGAISNYNYLIDSNGDSSSGITIQTDNVGNGYYTSFLPGAADKLGEVSIGTGFHLTVATYDDTDIIVTDNGTEIVNVEDTGGVTTDTLVLGNHAPLGSYPFGGDIAEVIMYNNVVAGVDLVTIGQYFTEKYDI